MATHGSAVSGLTGSLKEKLYTGPIRRVLRKLGVGRLLGAARALRAVGYRARLRMVPETNLSIRVGAWTATFRTSSSLEREEIASLGHEGRLLRRVIREVREGDVVFDIGTSLGLYTVFFAKATGPTGRVVGFEPEARTHRRVQESLGLNSLPWATVFDVALGCREGRAVLAVDERLGSGVHRIVNDSTPVQVQRVQEVRVVAGDEFIVEKRLPPPNVIKVDVEGMEEEVLLGLRRTLSGAGCRAVFCEVHFSILEQRGRRDAPRRIVALLRESGLANIEWPDHSHFIASRPV